MEPFDLGETRRRFEVPLSQRNSVRFVMALSTGLRQGEVLGLKWSDIDLDAGTLRVKRQRLWPEWVHGCTEPCGHKFGGYCLERVNTRPETGDDWKQLLSGAEVRDARLHDARHTAATFILQAGILNRVAQSTMGWSDAKMARRYQHVVAPIQRDAGDRLGELLRKPRQSPK